MDLHFPLHFRLWICIHLQIVTHCVCLKLYCCWGTGWIGPQCDSWWIQLQSNSCTAVAVLYHISLGCPSVHWKGRYAFASPVYTLLAKACCGAEIFWFHKYMPSAWHFHFYVTPKLSHLGQFVRWLAKPTLMAQECTVGLFQGQGSGLPIRGLNLVLCSIIHEMLWLLYSL